MKTTPPDRGRFRVWRHRCCWVGDDDRQIVIKTCAGFQTGGSIIMDKPVFYIFPVCFVFPESCSLLTFHVCLLLTLLSLGVSTVKHSQWKFVFLFLAASQARACHIYVHFTPCSRQRAIMFHPRDGGPVRKSQICDKDDDEWLLSLMMKTFIALALMTEEVGWRRRLWRRGWCWCWWRRWWCLRLCPDVPTLLQSHFCHADNFGQEPLSLSCGYTHCPRQKAVLHHRDHHQPHHHHHHHHSCHGDTHTGPGHFIHQPLPLAWRNPNSQNEQRVKKIHPLLATPVEDPPSLIGVQAKQIESLHTEANTDLYFGSVWISKYRYKYKKNQKSKLHLCHCD